MCPTGSPLSLTGPEAGPGSGAQDGAVLGWGSGRGGGHFRENLVMGLLAKQMALKSEGVTDSCSIPACADPSPSAPTWKQALLPGCASALSGGNSSKDSCLHPAGGLIEPP